MAKRNIRKMRVPGCGIRGSGEHAGKRILLRQVQGWVALGVLVLCLVLALLPLVACTWTKTSAPGGAAIEHKTFLTRTALQLHAGTEGASESRRFGDPYTTITSDCDHAIDRAAVVAERAPEWVQRLAVDAAAPR